MIEHGPDIDTNPCVPGVLKGETTQTTAAANIQNELLLISRQVEQLNGSGRKLFLQKATQLHGRM